MAGIIRPQPGFQTKFLSSAADIIIGGAAAGVGKSYALLLDPLRDYNNPGFGGVIFRRTSPQIRNQGGLWDTSQTIYPHAFGEPKESTLEWKFKSGAKIKFSHLEHEKNIYDWQGAQLPFIGFDELSHFCLTPETEVLTERGFKKITDIKIGELVASLSNNEVIEYKPVEAVHLFPFNGKLKTINQRNGVSFRATPNHKAVVMKQLPVSKKSHGVRYNGWKFREVSKLKTCAVPRSGKFAGEEVEYFEFERPTNRGHGRNSNSIERMPMDIWLQYLGWYLSEGSAYTSNNRSKSPMVNIRQTREEHYPELIELHNKTGFRWKFRSDGAFFIFSRQLFDILKPMGKQKQRRVPEYVFKLSVRQQKIFFDAFMRGDGYITKGGGVSLGLCNSLLIDDLQIIGFQIGMVGTKAYQKVKDKYDVYRLTLSRCSSYNMIRKNQWVEEDYEGSVHCISVKDNHNFYIRHNGRCCWTGNSSKQFFYLLSRNRSTCGVKPYVRATCNPDPGGWISELISWWIHPETGYPIADRDGVIRYFMRDGEHYIWGDTKDEVLQKARHLTEGMPADIDTSDFVKSITFIAGSIYDNKELLKANPQYLANLMAQDEETKAALLYGSWKQVISDRDIYDPTAFSGMFDNVRDVKRDRRCITADIALEGSNKLVVGYWEGFELMNIEVLDKSDGRQVIELISGVARHYGVNNSDICFDADGVGGYVDGYIPGSVDFHGGGRAMEVLNTVTGRHEVENYANLRAQCYYRSGLAISRGERKINPAVANKMYDDRTTVRQRFMIERRAIKKDAKTPDGKLKIISKDEMKAKLNGDSPDLMDMLMMRERLELGFKFKPVAV